MDFSEKIAMLRRQKNWSQEELAEKLMVTRQAVSKWESAQSMPDLDKLVQLSELLGVSTDYLLKSDRDAPEAETPQRTQEKASAKRVTRGGGEPVFVAASGGSSEGVAWCGALRVVSDCSHRSYRAGLCISCKNSGFCCWRIGALRAARDGGRGGRTVFNFRDEAQRIRIPRARSSCA